jgi:hypothetical protein
VSKRVLAGKVNYSLPHTFSTISIAIQDHFAKPQPLTRASWVFHPKSVFGLSRIQSHPFHTLAHNFSENPKNLLESLKTGVMAFMEEIRRHSLLTEDSIGLLSMEYNKYNSLQNNIYS